MSISSNSHQNHDFNSDSYCAVREVNSSLSKVSTLRQRRPFRRLSTVSSRRVQINFSSWIARICCWPARTFRKETMARLKSVWVSFSPIRRTDSHLKMSLSFICSEELYSWTSENSFLAYLNFYGTRAGNLSRLARQRLRSVCRWCFILTAACSWICRGSSSISRREVRSWTFLPLRRN